MDSIITDIVKIIKSENNIIAREKALLVYFSSLIETLMARALEQVDDSLAKETKQQGFQTGKKNKRSITTTFGKVSYYHRRYVCPDN